MSATIVVVSVLYGNRRVPDLLIDASVKGCRVIVVDNSSDLSEAPETVEVLTPGSNLGYSRGINLALSRCKNFRVLVVVNPDVTGEVSELLRLASLCAESRTDMLAAPESHDGMSGWQLDPSLFETVVAYMSRGRVRRRRRERVQPIQDNQRSFLSGAFLLVSAGAYERLKNQDGSFLREDLFFMDDVELSRRALRRGVPLKVLPTMVPFEHVGGGSVRSRKAVGIYFSRVSKVRYWRGEHPAGVRALELTLLVEALVGMVVSRRRRFESGSDYAGFKATAFWLLSRSSQIDEEVLGNIGAK